MADEQDPLVVVPISASVAEKRNQIRDRFAMAALQGLLAGDVGEDIIYFRNQRPNVELLASHAYDIATAMMSAKEEYADDHAGDTVDVYGETGYYVGMNDVPVEPEKKDPS